MSLPSPVVVKLIFVLIDGLADLSISTLANHTPLSLSSTPILDKLINSSIAVTGLIDPVQPGLACGSDTAHLSLFNYPPALYYNGRGAFETLGSGLSLTVGDIAFKCNFAYLDKLALDSNAANAQNIVQRRKVDRSFPDWGVPLCSALNNSHLHSFPYVHIAVKYATEHRCGVRVRLDKAKYKEFYTANKTNSKFSYKLEENFQLSDYITGTDPLYDGLQLLHCKPTVEANNPEYHNAVHTAEIINELSQTFQKVLNSHPINQNRIVNNRFPANIVLLRGAARMIDFPPFSSRNPGFSAFSIAPTAIIGGLAQCLAMERINCCGATGDYNTNLSAKAAGLVENLCSEEKKYNFGFLHVKAVDDCGHDEDFRKKIYFLQKIDEMIGEIISGINERKESSEFVLCFTGDHSTPISWGDHTAEPVPLLLAHIDRNCSESCNNEGNNSNDDQNSLGSRLHLDEFICNGGKNVLGRFSGAELMSVISDYIKLVQRIASSRD
jgi:2,3-diphosphopglycerate-independent phosphoglycerate mutase